MTMTDRLILRLPEEVQEFLADECRRSGDTPSVVARGLIRRSREFVAWQKRKDATIAREAREARRASIDAERDQARAERQARRSLTDAERQARREAKEQEAREQAEADLLYECSLYRDRQGIYCSDPHTRERYTWRAYLERRRSNNPDVRHYRQNNAEQFDDETRNIKDTRESVYLRHGLIPPALPAYLFEPVVPRCQHWVKLGQPCYDCEMDELEARDRAAGRYPGVAAVEN